MSQIYKNALCSVCTLFFLLFIASVEAFAGVNLVVNNDDRVDPIPAGGEVVYDVRVTNSSETGTDATGVKLTVTIPSGTSLVSATGTDVTCDTLDDTHQVCDFGTLPATTGGKTATVTLQTTVQDFITLGAVATSIEGATDGDNGSLNNTDDESTTINAGANLELALSGPATAQAGETVSYNLTVTNNGPDAAGDQQIFYPMPSGFSLDSSSLPSGCSESGGTVTCNVSGSIANGSTVNIGPITGQIIAAGDSTITHSASISVSPSAPVSDPQDPDTADNTATFDTEVSEGSDLALSKSRSVSGNILVGDSFNYILTPTYTGNSPSTIEAIDTLPANFTIGAVEVSQNGWTCGVSDQTVTCNKPSGDAAGLNQALGVITIPVTAISSGSGVVNSASISADLPTDPNSSNNTATDSVNLIDPTVNLDLTKTGPSPALVVVDTPFNYNITPRNNGTTGFYGDLVITENVPADLTITAINLNGWSCDQSADITGPATLTCQRTYDSNAKLAAGSNAPTLGITAKATAAGLISNSATISTPNCNLGVNQCNDGDLAHYDVTASIDTNSADISILKTVVGPNPVPAGDILSYQLEVVNSGPTPSTSVVLSDTFATLINNLVGPDEGYVGHTINAGVVNPADISCSTMTPSSTSRRLTCNIASLPVCTQGSDCPTVTIEVRPGGNGGSRSNTATVVSNGTADPDHSNESATVSSTVDPRADIYPNKTATPDPVPVGQNLTYVVSVGNNGPSRAENVTATDSLPDNVTFVSATPSSGSCSTEPIAGGTTSSDQVICNLGTINQGAQQTVTIIVRPNLATIGTLSNSASVTTSTTETDDSNNSTSISSTVSAPALDLVINKTDNFGGTDYDPVAVGDTMRYQIKVSNSGPSASEGVTVTDTLPATNLSYQSVSGASCSTEPAVGSFGGTLICDLGYMPAGNSREFTVEMLATAKGLVGNSASVASDLDAYEPVDGNNSVTEQTTVRTKADMTILSKTPSANPVNLRQNFDFVIQVKNEGGAVDSGLAEADDVLVSDSLPSGMELTGAPTVSLSSGDMPTSTSCTGIATDTSFTCTLGTVTRDTIVDITVPVQLVSVTSMPQTFTNSTSVSTSSLDVDGTNDSNSGTVTTNSSSISGQVFRDFNADGSVTAGDTGISEATLTLSGTSFDGATISRTVNTDSSGNYTFTGLPASDGSGYTITELPVSAWETPENYLNDGDETAGTAGGSIAVNDEISGIVLAANTTVYDYLFAEIPIARIGLAKRVSSGPTVQADGTFLVTFELAVENFSLEQMNSLTITDDLTAGTAPFGALGTAPLSNGEYLIESSPSGTCGGDNAAYNGAGNTTVASGFSLNAGSICRTSFTVRVRPSAPLPIVQPSGGRYENQASINGTGTLSGQTDSDISDNGGNADGNNNNFAGDATESDLTPVTPTYGPSVAITKAISGGVSLAADLSVIVPVRLTVENTGNEPLNTISVSDDLVSRYGSYVAGGAVAPLTNGEYTIQAAPSGTCNNIDAGFDGDTTSELSAFAALAIGDSCTIDFSYRFMPTASTSYQNRADVSATSDYSTTAISDNDLITTPYPRLGLAEQVVGSSTTNADGTVSVPLSFIVKNLGGENLSSISISDDLSGVSPQFGSYVASDPDATEYSIETAPVFSGSCSSGTTNSSFNGDGDPLLASIGSLASGASCTITTTIRFRPGPPLPPDGNFTNQASATANGVSSGLAVSDLSDDGVNTDTDNDGIADEAGENDPTLVHISFTPQIALNKLRTAAEIINADGTVTVPFQLQVTNSGTEPLVNVSIEDTLAGAAPIFGTYVAGGPAATLSNGEYTIQTVPAFNGVCTTGGLTADYNGDTQTELAGLSRLDVLDSCKINFELRFKPTSPLPVGGYSNQGTTAGTGEFSGGAPVTDLSQDGLDPDPDANNDPTDNSDPTPVNPVHTARIGIAKALQSGLLVNANGSYSGTFRLVVENLGNEELQNVNINDVLNSAPANLGSFVAGGAGATLSAGEYSIESAPAFVGVCTNGTETAAFNGESAPQLATISELAIGSSCTLEYGFRFVPQPGTSYLNQATAAGTGAFSASVVNDLSDDGTNPDSNGNGDPTEAGENNPTPIPIPRIGVAKSVGAVVNNGDGTYDVPFVLTLINAGETSLASVQISDDLAEFGSYTVAAIPAAGEYSISTAPVVVNPSNGAALVAVAAGSFTGAGAGTGLLVPASSSLPNFGSGSESMAEIHFTLRFFPTTAGPFNNNAIATGSSPAGGDVTDDSVSGNTPDADGNGDPGDDDSPSVVNLSGQVIGVAKAVGSIVQLTTKSYDIPYSLILLNPSATLTATNVQLSDDLSSTFPTAASISVSAPVTVSSCTGTVLNAAVPAFDGTTRTQLLAGDQNLQPNEQCTISFTARVDFGTNPLPDVLQNNSAIATTAETPGGVLITSDLSDSGSVPDSDGNGNASDPGENDPTPVDFRSSNLSSVSGSIWVDSNHDRIDNDGSATNLPTFIVEVVNSIGTIVGSATTDETGSYSVDNLFPSTSGDPTTYYDVRFRESVSGAIYGNPLSQDPDNPNGNIVDGIISGLQLLPGTNTVQQDLPLDPSGVVYDSVTRLPVAGATVTLSGPVGFDPVLHLVGGTANVTQLTGITGYYQYILLAGAPIGDYSLTVTPPSGYVPTSSSIIPACTNAPTVGATPDPALVQSSSAPPTLSATVHDATTCPGSSSGFVAGASSTQYYYRFNLAPGTSGNVVNNHIPVDPVLGGAITLVKTTPLVNVSIGQLVPYTITATNTLAADLSNIDIRDTLPPGFKYKSGSASLDGISVTPAISGRVLSWTDLSFPANATRTVKLLLVVGAGVQPGEYINTAQAFNNLVPAPDNAVSNVATAAVRVIPDPLFDCSDVIGKVFDDQNANGYQDDGEPGIPNVRVATARGLLVTSDAEGRYHITCAMVPNEFRGSNFIMKLDERSLPSGYRVTTENPRTIHLTRGKMGKLNFGAAIHRVVRFEITGAAFVEDTNQPVKDLSQAIIKLPEQLREAPSIIRLAYNQQGESQDLIKSRLQEVRKQIEHLWKDQGCCYALVFEEEIFHRDLQSNGGEK